MQNEILAKKSLLDSECQKNVKIYSLNDFYTPVWQYLTILSKIVTWACKMSKTVKIIVFSCLFLTVRYQKRSNKKFRKHQCEMSKNVMQNQKLSLRISKNIRKIDIDIFWSVLTKFDFHWILFWHFLILLCNIFQTMVLLAWWVPVSAILLLIITWGLIHF